MIDNGVCDKRYAWNPSNCECKCNKSFDVGEYLDPENFKCKKKLLDELVEECNETIDEVKIVSEKSVKINVILAQCILCYFGYSLQLMLEFVLILFTINTWIVIKKMFLNMITSIKQQFN